VGGYTYLYCERTLRQLRPNYDPETEPDVNVEAGLFPAAILVALLFHKYVFGDPLATPSIAEIIIGLLIVTTVLTAFGDMMFGSRFGRQFGPLDTDELGGRVSLDGISVEKSVKEVEDGIVVTVELRGEKTRHVRFQEHLAWWVPLESIQIDPPKSYFVMSENIRIPGIPDGEWDWTHERPSRLSYETTLSPNELQRIRYWCRLPKGKYADDVFHETIVVPNPAYELQEHNFVGGVDSKIRGTIEPNIPLYYKSAVEIGLFFAPLAVAYPLITGGIAQITTAYALFGWGFVIPLLLFLPFGLLTQRKESERIARELGVSLPNEPESPWIARELENQLPDRIKFLSNIFKLTEIRVLAIMAIIILTFHLEFTGSVSDLTVSVIALISTLLLSFGGATQGLRVCSVGYRVMTNSIIRGLFFTFIIPAIFGYTTYTELARLK
jgi:hypothetical protein